MQLHAEAFLTIILVIITCEYILTTFIDLLNLGKDSTSNIPLSVKAFYDENKYIKALAYQREHTYFGLANGFFSLIFILLVIIFGVLGWLDSWVAIRFDTLIGQTLAFFGIIFLVNDVVNTPFQLYATFKIEEKYGFNKSTLKTFFLDKLKGYLLTAVLGAALISLLIFLITTLGHSFWWIFWIVIAMFMIAMNFFYTSLIVPLFNKLTPLEEGGLKERIMQYGKSVDFPINNIFVIDGSKRSAKANAYFSGFGSRKKIVLFDTLIENHTDDELVAILAHEVGHYKLKHTYLGMFSGVLQIGVMLCIMSFMIFEPELSKALGAERLSFGVNLIAFGIIYTPVSLLTGLLSNFISRKHEFEADSFAAKTFKADALMAALKKLSVDNLSNMKPHKLYVFFHYSHPPLLKRLESIERTS